MCSTCYHEWPHPMKIFLEMKGEYMTEGRLNTHPAHALTESNPQVCEWALYNGTCTASQMSAIVQLVRFRGFYILRYIEGGVQDSRDPITLPLGPTWRIQYSALHVHTGSSINDVEQNTWLYFSTVHLLSCWLAFLYGYLCR